jgi:hypothetical protein
LYNLLTNSTNSNIVAKKASNKRLIYLPLLSIHYFNAFSEYNVAWG